LVVRSDWNAIVRHPIYTGLLLGFAGSVLAIGEWRGVLALLIVTVALWRKLRVEEGRSDATTVWGRPCDLCAARGCVDSVPVVVKRP